MSDLPRMLLLVCIPREKGPRHYNTPRFTPLGRFLSHPFLVGSSTGRRWWGQSLVEVGGVASGHSVGLKLFGVAPARLDQDLAFAGADQGQLSNHTHVCLVDDLEAVTHAVPNGPEHGLELPRRHAFARVHVDHSEHPWGDSKKCGLCHGHLSVAIIVSNLDQEARSHPHVVVVFLPEVATKARHESMENFRNVWKCSCPAGKPQILVTGDAEHHHCFVR
mmetsp:Transcript_59656/g.122359  ORF Transcript_59656/g.122359 Transcript_59656/m.122359 type:complete len:220 (-) Transcript_59656:1331-1990(-)